MNPNTQRNVTDQPTMPAGGWPAGTYTTANTNYQNSVNNPVKTLPETNLCFRGIKVFINIPASAGSGTIVVTIYQYDAFGNRVAMLASASLSSANAGLNVLTLYPGIPVTANVSANDVLPYSFAVEAVISTAALKVAVSYSLLAA